MKRLYFLAAFCAFATASYAQTEPTKKDTTYKTANNDTIRIGSILIIKKNKKAKGDSTIVIADIRKRNPRKSTNYMIFDVGFANLNDNTNYGNTAGYTVSKPGAQAFNEADLKLKGGKSLNINLWFFMQKYSLVKNNVNLKYGLGIELNNYRFKTPISFKESGIKPYSGGVQTNSAFVFRDSITFSKNKLAADYLTVPLMLNFATNKKTGKPALSASVGVSAGYLYSQRNKQESGERGKQKNKGEYDMERFKLSYIAELGLGPVRFYGSYSPNSMFERGLDVKPYNIGIRFSNW
ncbi:MAG: PorT family protein [Ferruginibacter sp.]|nr:PorT family protein [Ferruginibacter sp.]